jgi:hypothetical protein
MALTKRTQTPARGEGSRAAAASVRKVLFLAQVPPPLHGASAMSKRVHEIMQARGDLVVEHLWLGGAVTMNDVGRRSPGKFFGFFKFLVILAWKFVTGQRYGLAYLTLAPFSHAALRDGLLVAMSKMIGERTLVHLHAERLEAVLAGATLPMRLLRSMIRGCELIAITEGVAASVRGTGHFSAVHILPNCADDPGEPEIGTAAHIRCGFLANLDPKKGVLRFLDCIEALKREGEPVVGRIAGPSTAELTIEALKEDIRRRGLDGVVEAVGPLYGEEKVSFFRHIDVFVYLSQRDYFPLVVIEAMACGGVPIVYDFAGQRELVSPAFAGNVVMPDQPVSSMTAAAGKIIRGYNDHRDLLAKDRAKARAFFLASYTQDKFSVRLNAILDDRAQDHNGVPSF